MQARVAEVKEISPGLWLQRIEHVEARTGAAFGFARHGDVRIVYYYLIPHHPFWITKLTLGPCLYLYIYIGLPA